MTWRDIPGWSGFYQVSDIGSVRSITRTVHIFNPHGVVSARTYKSKLLKLSVGKNGYPWVSLTSPLHGRWRVYVHKLVTLTFIGPCPVKYEVCHNDGNKLNNALSNLRYDSRSANSLDRHKHGTMPDYRGEKARSAKLTKQEVEWIRKSIGHISIRSMAKKFNVHHSTVLNIIHRKTWSHI